MSNPEIKILFFDQRFFLAPPKKIKSESDPVTNRTYFLIADKIVAVGEAAAR